MFLRQFDDLIATGHVAPVLGMMIVVEAIEPLRALARQLDKAWLFTPRACHFPDS